MTLRFIAFAIYIGLVKSANDTLPSTEVSGTSWRTELATDNETSTSVIDATASSNGTLTPATGKPIISASTNTEALTTPPIDISSPIDISMTAPSYKTTSSLNGTLTTGQPIISASANIEALTTLLNDSSLLVTSSMTAPLYGTASSSNDTLTPVMVQPNISASANTEALTTSLIDSSVTAPSYRTTSVAPNDTHGLNVTNTTVTRTSLRSESMPTATSPALHSATASAPAGTSATMPTAASQPTNSSTTVETATSSTSTLATLVYEPQPVAEWTRIVNAPAAFVESTAYNVTCIGTPNVTRWIIGRSTTQQPGMRISRWLFTNTLSIVAHRRMQNWTLSCLGGNVTTNENNTLVIIVWWGPSFGGTRRTVQILPYSGATYLATCGGLSGNPPPRYHWQTASGLRQPFNDTASIAFVNPTIANATGQAKRVVIPFQDGFGESYLSVPVLFVLPLPIGTGAATASVVAAAESRATCRAWNPASGAVDSVDVVLKTSRPGSVSYSGIQSQASYTAGQTISVSCTVRSTFVHTIGLRRGFLGEYEVVSCTQHAPFLRSGSRLPSRTRASVSLRVGPLPPTQTATDAQSTAAYDSGDALVAASSPASAGPSPAAAGYDRLVTCGDVPWRNADGFTLTFTLYDVDPALTGPYQCFAVDEQPYYYAYVSPALQVDLTTARTASEEAPLVSDFFFFSIYDIPSIPRIFVQRALVEGERQDATCTSSGDYPAPSLRWTLVTGSESVSVYQLDSTVTLVAQRRSHSSLLRVSFVANRRMDGKILRCSIEGHPLGFSYQNVAVLRVVYGPTMADSNRSGVVIRRPLWEPLWLPCRVDSKPPAVIWWYMRSPSGSVSTIPRDYYQSSQGVILEVPYAYREPGLVAYICRAFNLESRKTSDLEVSVIWVQRDGGSPNDGSTTDSEGGNGGVYGPFGPPVATKRPSNASPQKVLIYVVIPIVTLASVLLAFVCAIACLLSRRHSDIFLVEQGPSDGGKRGGGHVAAQRPAIFPLPPPPGHGGHPVIPTVNGGRKPASTHHPAAKLAGQNEVVGTGVLQTGGANPVAGAPAAPADHRASPKVHKRKATRHGGDMQPASKIRMARTAVGGDDDGRSPERKPLASAQQNDSAQRTPLAADGKPELVSPTRDQRPKKESKRESREPVTKKQTARSAHSTKRQGGQDKSARRKGVETGSLARGDEAALAATAPVENGAALPNEVQAAHSPTVVRREKDRLRRTLAKTDRREDDANRAQRPQAAAAGARHQRQSPPPAAEGHQPTQATREVAAEDRKAKTAGLPTVAPEGAAAIGTAARSGDKRAEAFVGGSPKRSPRKGRQQRAANYSPAVAAAITTAV